jgi:hypothetical protein
MLVASGCAPRVTLTERFRALDADAKAEFLQRYPDTRAEDRPRLLSRLEARGISPGEIRHYPTLKSLELQKDYHADGGVALRAILFYADGRRADVTGDSRWNVDSRLGTLEETTRDWGDGTATRTGEDLVLGEGAPARILRAACIAGPITVTANFLDEREAQETFDFHRQLRELQLSPAADAQPSNGFLRLRAVATCEDNTSTDLTCKVSYRTEGRAAVVEGCGTLRLEPDCTRDSDTVRVIAAYGGLESSLLVHAPCGMQRTPRP